MTSDSASRVTRSSSSLRRSLLLFAAVLAGVTALRAQETPPPAPSVSAPTPGTPTAAAEPPASAPPAAAQSATGAPAASAASPTAEAPAPAPAAGKPAGPVGPTRDRFEPTEKVRADFDVSFPVDI
jgi:hypothetical protein